MRRLLVFLMLYAGGSVLAQERVLTFGIEFKPMMPGDLFRTGTADVSEQNLDFSINNKMGYSGGMLVRYGFTKSISLESGINFVRRNYELSVTDKDIAFEGLSRFAVVGYEIPTRGLVYVRLGEQVYMNAAFGLSFNFYPSDVSTSGDYFDHISRRRSWVQTAGVANLGWEYRTLESGIIYFGASFHRPFNDMYNSKLRYQTDTYFTDVNTTLNAAYLTFDLRYFFHEEPLKKERKGKEENKLREFRKMQKQRDKKQKQSQKSS